MQDSDDSEVDRSKYQTQQVLAHGLFGFDVLGPPSFQLHYWRGIAEALRVIGATVYITKVPRIADVSIRAQSLKTQLETMTSNGKQQRTELNLIGHSMVIVQI